MNAIRRDLFILLTVLGGLAAIATPRLFQSRTPERAMAGQFKSIGLAQRGMEEEMPGGTHPKRWVQILEIHR